jgi:putative transposase
VAGKFVLIPYKDIKIIMSALLPIYKAATEEAALEELDQFERTWGQKYPLQPPESLLIN